MGNVSQRKTYLMLVSPYFDLFVKTVETCNDMVNIIISPLKMPLEMRK
jgi:hypothetical protein